MRLNERNEESLDQKGDEIKVMVVSVSRTKGRDEGHEMRGWRYHQNCSNGSSAAENEDERE